MLDLIYKNSKNKRSEDARFKRWWILAGFNGKIKTLGARETLNNVLDALEATDTNIQKGIEHDNIPLRHRVVFWIFGLPVVLAVRLLFFLAIAAIYVYRSHTTYSKEIDEKKRREAISDLLDETRLTNRKRFKEATSKMGEDYDIIVTPMDKDLAKTEKQNGSFSLDDLGLNLELVEKMIDDDLISKEGRNSLEYFDELVNKTDEIRERRSDTTETAEDETIE